MNNLEHFLAFVQHNLEQPCLLDSFHGKRLSTGTLGTCPACLGRALVPQPAAVELYNILMLVDDISGVVVPRNYAEMHLALEEWLVNKGFSILHIMKGVEIFRPGAKWTADWHGHELEEAAEAALIAGGWKALEKATCRS